MRERREPANGIDSPSILLIDDEPTTLDVLEMFLETEGYTQVTRLDDSTRAVTVLKEQPPDLVLLDLMMPGVGGLEILGSMRQDENLCRIPVIILTSSTDAEKKLEALELGATDFLSKPVDPSELALRLRNTLSAKAYQDRLAYYDATTGLPNRVLFVERLALSLRRAGARPEPRAVLHLAVDRFRELNHTLGHAAGDALLSAVATRLDKAIGSGEPWPATAELRSLIARIGGSEFGLLIEGGSPADTSRVTRRALAALAEPFCVDQQDLFLSASVGIALFPGDGADAEALMANAGIACSQARRSGGNAIQYFDPSLNSASRERLGLENQLRRAIERDELRLFFQPKVDVRTGRITGGEALMRWMHPELGLLTPGRFIAIAEGSDLITELGEWALRAACRACDAWERAGLGPVRISVNVASRQFRLGRLFETVRSLGRDEGFDLRHLVLELTEGTIMEDPSETSAMLRAIRELGASISIDDFGTGYSSLGYLKHFPLDELKIDRSFIRNVPQDAADNAIVKSIVALAQGLGLRVVAEGVESEEQLGFLRAIGCDEYQGFLRSHAVPEGEWVALLRAGAEPRG